MQSNPQLEAQTQQELDALKENWRQIRQLLEETVPQILRYLTDFKQLRARYNRDKFNCDARLNRLADRADGHDMRLVGFEERLKNLQDELTRLKQG